MGATVAHISGSLIISSNLPKMLSKYLKGAWSLFVVVAMSCFMGTRGSLGPTITAHIMAFIFDLVAFIVAMSNFPYTSGCDVSNYEGCQTLKAAIGLDCVLWYFPFPDRINAPKGSCFFSVRFICAMDLMLWR